VVHSETKRRGEGHVDLNFLAGDGTFAASVLVGAWVYARNHRIGGGKVRVEHRRRKGELPRHSAIPRGELIVGRGIYASRHVAVRWVNRIDGKDVVELDLHLIDGAQRRAGGQESDERRAGNQSWILDSVATSPSGLPVLKEKDD
jgi:hypothetical protein